MNHLKRLGLTFTFISVLAVTTFADQTGTPPCADPGQTSTPPCVVQPLSEYSADPGQTESPPAAPVVDVTDITEAVMWALSLF